MPQPCPKTTPRGTGDGRRADLRMLALSLAGLILLLSLPAAALAQTADEPVVFGVKLRVGGRYDDVRMCVGSPPGVKGGPAMDISFFTEVPLGDGVALEADLPVARPILFAAAFSMLQFEPSVTLKMRTGLADDVDLVAGPLLGLSLHYGPDYESGPEVDERGASFFALGPIVGGYVGVDLARPQGSFDVQLGVSPYFSPLFSIDDPDDHRGYVVGGLLDGSLRFR